MEKYNQVGPPHILCFSTFLKYLDNRIWCTFPELLCRYNKPSPLQCTLQYMEDAKYLMIKSTWHQDSWSIRTDNVNPCDTSLLPPHQPVREAHKRLIEPVTSLPQFSSVAQSCVTLRDPMDCSTPGLPVHHRLPEFTQTHIHWVGDAIQPFHPLSSPSPPTFNLSQHQGLSNE